MTFQPYPTRSGFIALGVALLTGLAAVLALFFLLPRQDDLPAIFRLLVSLLVMLGVMQLALYWAVVAFKLRYDLTRNGLAIQWGFAQQLVPFDRIEKIIPAKDLAAPPRFKGLNMAGLRLGRGELAEYGPLKFHTTATWTDSLLVVTADQAYVISPRQPDHFVRAWQVRRSLGPTQYWPTGLRRGWPLNTPLLTDPLTWWLTGLSILTCLALFGYLSLTFPTLPRSLPIHFDAFGVADRIADKSALFTLPAAGFLVLVLNTFLGSLIYRWEKVAAYLLWGSALIVQICLWIATLTIIP